MAAASAAAAAAAVITTKAIEEENSHQNLFRQVRGHEVAIAELSSLSSSRAVYQKNGNIYFHTSIPRATASEQKQLDLTKSKLQKPNSA